MTYGILLAAGLGRRIGMPKALLTLDGQTFHQLAVGAFRLAGLEIVVVINPALVDVLPSEVSGEHRVINPDPDHESGMFGSVRAGMREAIRLGASSVVLLPVDHPLVTSDDIRSVTAKLGEGGAVAVATHEGRRGHPIGFNQSLMQEVMEQSSMGTLRDILWRDPTRVVEAPASRGALVGVNSKEDLERVLNRTFR